MIEGLGTEPLRAVFIRAPWIERHGPGVEVLAEVDGHPVVARQDGVLVCAFHPELTDDSRLHALFMAMATAARDRVGEARMRDGRVDSLARILVEYSTAVKEGDVVVIQGSSAGEPLIHSVYEHVLTAGGPPIVQMSFEGQQATYFSRATDAQLEWVSPPSKWAAEEADVSIAIGADLNTRELSQVPPGAPDEAPRRDQGPDGDRHGPRRQGRAPLGLHAVAHARLRLRRRDEPRATSRASTSAPA